MWDKFNKAIPEVLYPISEETFQNARIGILLHWNANWFVMFCLIIMEVAQFQLNQWLLCPFSKRKKGYLKCLTLILEMVQRGNLDLLSSFLSRTWKSERYQ